MAGIRHFGYGNRYRPVGRFSPVLGVSGVLMILGGVRHQDGYRRFVLLSSQAYRKREVQNSRSRVGGRSPAVRTS